MKFENEPANEDFEGFHVTNEKKMIHHHSCQKSTLEDADIEEVLNIGIDAPVVHSLSGGGIAEMMLVTDNHKDSGNYDDDYKTVNTGGKIPIENMVKMCGLDKHMLVSKQGIMAVYSVKMTLLRQKPS